MKCLNEEQTSVALPYGLLIEYLEKAVVEYADGLIHCPIRQVLPMVFGSQMLSMPAVAHDIAIHKFLSHCPSNRLIGLPLIQGNVSVLDALTGKATLLLDGPTVTGRRTACMSMLGLKHFAPLANHVAIIGAGEQAGYHLEALSELYPGIRVDVHGQNIDKTKFFCSRRQHLNLDVSPRIGSVREEADTVITLTPSTTPIYHLPARSNRLLIAVGAFTPEMVEFSTATIHGSQIFVDDLHAAQREAGDLIQADINWGKVSTFASAIRDGYCSGDAIFYKVIGSAAWDLAAARCATHVLA